MEPSQTSQSQHHGTPLRRILTILFFTIFVAILSSLGTYYFLNKQSKTEFESAQKIQELINELPTTKLTKTEDIK